MFSRKLSLTKANGAASPAAPVIPDVPVDSEPISVSSLTPREIVVKGTTATEATITYSLPPTSTLIGGPIDVRVMIRPSRLFKSCAKEESEIQKQISDIRMKDQMKNVQQFGKPGYDHHQAFVDQMATLAPLQRRISDIWTEYEKKCKELLPVHPEASGSSNAGYYSMDLETNLCYPGGRVDEVGIISVRKSPETNTIIVKDLSSNVFYEVVFMAKRSNKDTPEGEGNDIWSPMSAPAGFSTKTAAWQLALEKSGLRHLIEPFTNKGLDSFQKWMDIKQETKEEIGIDAAADSIISDILAQNGIITAAEQLKIDRERTEMGGVVNTLLAELKATLAAISTGDAVTEKIPSNRKRGPKFGIVSSINDKGTEVAVRWEDPRTKDPANSMLESGVKIATLQKSQFTLFLSHAQADAQNQVAHLSVLLRDRDAKIWFDQDSERLEARDMVRGIANSKVFLLYLTRTYFDRWFCRLEASVAKALQKQLIIVYEPDERFGGTGDYVSLVNQCTKRFPEFRDFLLNTEAVPMARRAFQRRAVVDEICKRAGLTSKPGSFTEKDTSSNSASIANAGLMEVADLKQMVLDLKMEMNDIKAENRELRRLIESLAGNNTE